ncbi:putative N-acetylmannosamine-6-phosphate 2-epimerase [Phyllobacterium endophyticum]|uniref:Putative N-acetylmannosamine-6-phosphate 2-epimerase n=1 Tax=Phyllobacterium endophyticum TaxID=1149773 RepID=A0A2P7AMD2_9HYPH|nr:putative N-acetylmannosamine-6-phosphate 2-epimerase [Phyllobacterium endophyticum]MBB3238423.1 N-acetylmannosamine-6-phosphate 2-epimerase/N-acetylmannosamine kinase [Phyllobacterium endophyticum]PSH55361.1 N-acetylmannosamine kinase [Phyllobacterium endophyticum]TYR40087.1 ROK family protein [Phyllobacterium endophyticum]
MKIGDLKGKLIVSCQPVPGGPMDDARMVTAFALAAVAGGASALRIESLDYVRAVRAATDVPIIGIVKKDLETSPVRITPHVADAVALARAGAQIVAFDATLRSRPDTIANIIAAIHANGALAMADCSSVEDGLAALKAGADCVGSTLSGYTGGPVPDEPDFDLITQLHDLTPHVIAEGRIRTPEQAIVALRRGASSVVVGSAITRTEHVTSWFKQAIAAETANKASKGVLAIDIGGTKTLACLVKDGKIARELHFPTDHTLGPDGWVEAVAATTLGWKGLYDRVAAAVTGIVVDGHWAALNPATLKLPASYALADKLRDTFGVSATAFNDAQSAAWGEHRFGAGAREDMVFLTISTGIGGGIVLNGRLLQGTAGHFGLFQGYFECSNRPLEDSVSGHWMNGEARKAGFDLEAREIFAAARSGAPWASHIISISAKRAAMLCQNIQLALDPRRIIIGGGIGLAEGYIDQVRSAFTFPALSLRPTLVPAGLGRHAGVIGAADLVAQSRSIPGGYNA